MFKMMIIYAIILIPFVSCAPTKKQITRDEIRNIAKEEIKNSGHVSYSDFQRELRKIKNMIYRYLIKDEIEQSFPEK